MNNETNSAASGGELRAMHGEFRDAVLEAKSSYRALGLLIRLLNGETVASFSMTDREGLTLLLEAIREHLDLSIQGLGVTAQAMGMPDAWELVH